MTGSGSLRTATTNELQTALSAGDVCLIDVRTATEFGASHIAEARNLPLGSVDAWVDELPKGEVWLICRSGQRSGMAAKRVRASGRQAVNVEGGMMAWTGPVVRGRSLLGVVPPLVASLTLGLAPFLPEPHLLGKLRWVAGGAVGMGTMDWVDLLFHGAPWVWLGVALVRYATTPVGEN